MRFHLQHCRPTAMSRLQTLSSSSKQKYTESKQLSLAEAFESHTPM